MSLGNASIAAAPYCCVPIQEWISGSSPPRGLRLAVGIPLAMAGTTTAIAETTNNVAGTERAEELIELHSYGLTGMSRKPDPVRLRGSGPFPII